MRLSAHKTWISKILARLKSRPVTVSSSHSWMKTTLFSSSAVVLIVTAIVAIVLSHAQQNLQIAETLTSGNAAAALPLLRRYGCTGCHTMPGIPGADGKVGPALSGLQERVYIGGHVRNTSGNLIRFLVDPRSFSPDSAMPATGVTEKEAHDIAAWLYAH